VLPRLSQRQLAKHASNQKNGEEVMALDALSIPPAAVAATLGIMVLLITGVLVPMQQVSESKRRPKKRFCPYCGNRIA
jgi:hypothetical protein